MIELRANDFPSFFQAPHNAYGSDAPFVSVFDADLRRFLDPKANPLFRSGDDLSLFTALRDGRPVGRITAHVHDGANQQYGERRASFGYFDCADDGEAASHLLGAAESWARRRGYDGVWGPFNLTAMQQMGVVTAGFERRPYSDQVWNPPHIVSALERGGYEREFPMTSFELDTRTASKAETLRPEHEALVRESGIRFEAMKTRNVDRLFPALTDVLNDGFKRNPLFVKLSQEEFAFQAKDLSWVIDPRISCLAWEGDELVGALICIPDLNPLLRRCRSRLNAWSMVRLLVYRGQCRRAVVIFQSVKERLQSRGVGAVLIQQVLLALRSANYEALGLTWVGDQNQASLAGVHRAGGRAMHRLHLYRKELR